MIYTLLILMAWAHLGYGCNDYATFEAETTQCFTDYNDTIIPLWTQLISDQDLEAFCTHGGPVVHDLLNCTTSVIENDGACNETVVSTIYYFLNISTYEFRQYCSGYCLLNNSEATDEAVGCTEYLNSTTTYLIAGFDQNTDFSAFCGTVHEALMNASTCFTAALEGHGCSEELMYNITELHIIVEHIYNLTCINDNFSLDILANCADVVTAFSGLTECLPALLYIASGDEDSDTEELSCTEGAHVIEYVMNCVGNIASSASCTGSVDTTLNALVTQQLDSYTAECGDYSGYITTTTQATTTTSGQAGMMYSCMVFAATTFMISLLKTDAF